jgi:Domain of unknown function (DUF4157)
MHQLDRKASPASSLDALGPREPDAPAPGRLARIAVAAAPEDSDAVRAAVGKSNDSASSALPFFDKIQRSFGRHDISAIQCHTGGEAQAAAGALGAEAFATGAHVAFGRTPTLHTAAHEAAHVVQQRAGVHLKGGIGADGDSYEQHADAVADRVVRGESAEELLDTMAGGAGATSHAGGGAVQCKRPGDAPPTLNEQLDNRLAGSGEGGTVPPEGTLVNDVAALFAGVGAPVAMNNAQDLVDFTLSHYNASPMAPHAHDLAALAAVLSTVLLTEFSNHNAPHPIAALDPMLTLQQMQAAVQPRIRTAVNNWCTANNHPVLSNNAIDATYHIDLSGVGDVASGARTRFLVDHPMTPGFTGTLTKPQQEQLRDALLEMTTVQRALSGEHGHVADIRSKGSPAVRNWLAPQIQVDDGSEYGTGEEDDDTLLQSSSVPGATHKRIAAAVEIVCSLVEQRTLAKIPEPVIFVHLAKDRSLLQKIQEGDFSAAKKLRAYSSGYEKAIHIDRTDPVETIVHEIGHQLEDQLPSETWLDIHRMLRGRHQQAVTGGAPDDLVAIYPGHKDQKVRDECAYRADMPATGAYSAKCYEGGGPTEVMSMAMEYLSNPKTAKQLITKDPLQAAIVLRGIAPQEFNLRVPPNLRALLPS